MTNTSRSLVSRTTCCALAAIAFAFAASRAVAQAPRSIAPLIPRLDSLAAAEFAQDSIGSITVGVIRGSDLAWNRSYGYADMKGRRLADRHTVYRIGSITKPFTAVMLMQLVEAGKVRLSDPIERYF